MCRAAWQSSHWHEQWGSWSGISLYRSTPPYCPRDILGREAGAHLAREETGGPQERQPLDALCLGPLPSEHRSHEVLIEGVKAGEELAALALHVDLLKAAEEVCRVCVARHCHLTQSITREGSCQTRPQGVRREESKDTLKQRNTGAGCLPKKKHRPYTPSRNAPGQACECRLV